MHENDQYRILTPTEYEQLRDHIPRMYQQMLIDTMLFTGMRYRELVLFSRRPVWLDAKNHAILLPDRFSKTGEGRTIHLTPIFAKTLSQHLREFGNLFFPHYTVMNRNLKRWQCKVIKNDSTGCWQQENVESWLTVKTFRKTWETWLICAGYDSALVAASQGHSQVIQLKHYLRASARLKSEMDAVRKYTEGWMK